MQCQKCNNELEVDSKFCAHCGTSVSEEVLAKMKEDSPTSKAKVYIFKGIALIIALFIYGMAITISKSMSGSDKVAIGGILLFYGVYALLSGLFLKEKSSIKRGGWILAIYIVGSIAFTYYYNNLDHSATATEGKVTITYGTEANSHYRGKYLCNDTQLLEITNKTLTIGNAVFEYYQFVTFQYGVTDAFNKDDNTEGAIMSKTLDREGHYSLNIRSFINKDEPPYVADCTKVK